MSQRKPPANLLSWLSKQFKARLPRSEISGLLGSGKSVDRLYDLGVFRLCNPGPDFARCPLGHHDGDGIIPVERRPNGGYEGLCVEHGRVARLAAEAVEWVIFDPAAWIEAVRSANGLVGDAAHHPAGFYLAGKVQTENKKAGLVMVSAQALGSRPATAPFSDAANGLLYIDLGGRSTAGTVNASDLFEDDLLTFRMEALRRLLENSPRSTDSTAGRFHKYSNGTRQPAPLSDDDYQREIAPSNIKKTDLFIDLAQLKAWKGGKQILHMANAGDGGRKKKLSPVGLRLVANYIQKRGTPRNPADMPPYEGKNVDSRSTDAARKMLLGMRKTLKLDAVLKTGDNPSGTFGGSHYYFEPPTDFQYVLITSAEEA